MILGFPIAESPAIVGANVLDTINLIVNEGDDHKSLVYFRWEWDVGDEPIVIANEMIHRSRLILKSG